jgi:hypothetical protein
LSNGKKAFNVIKNFILGAALAAATLAASGCASQDAQASNEPVVEREYPTGSSIPRKSGGSSSAATMSREDAERARDAQLPTTGTPFKP